MLTLVLTRMLCYLQCQGAACALVAQRHMWRWTMCCSAAQAAPGKDQAISGYSSGVPACNVALAERCMGHQQRAVCCLQQQA